MGEAHVRLVGLTKRFGRNAPVVDDVTLEIPRGKFTTLLGPSGCGKTTTLRLIAGFYEPDRGDIFLGDRRINDVPVHQRQTAMVFQDYALFPHMTVGDNVAYGPRLARRPAAEVQDRVASTLKFLGLTGLENRSPQQLSGGQQQRVALARALVMNPDVLLLDEPLSNLDAKLRVSIRAELTGIQRQLNLTTIYVTHDQEEALAMSDWVVVMNRGRVVQVGTPWDIYYRPQTSFVAEFVGAVNLVRAVIVGRSSLAIQVRLGDTEFDVEYPDGDQLSVGGAALLAIRPETLNLAAIGAQTGAGLISISGEIARWTFLGHLIRYTVRVSSDSWLVDRLDPGGVGVREGPVQVLVNPARVRMIREE